MQERPTFSEKASNWIKNSLTIRLMTIGILILLLLIPVSMVKNLIKEREYRQQDAIEEVSSKWGKKQTVTGLVLTVPYNTYSKVFDTKTEKYNLIKSREYAHFLPDQLTINGEVLPELRYRGIYEVIVYNSKLNLTGSFSNPTFEEWKKKTNTTNWKIKYYKGLGTNTTQEAKEYFKDFKLVTYNLFPSGTV